jgi:hypothetical protein
MIVSRFQIFCDGEHRDDVYWPEEGAVDGAIYTAGEARSEARKEGWGRADDGRRLLDLCPACFRKHQQSKLSEIRKRRRKTDG